MHVSLLLLFSCIAGESLQDKLEKKLLGKNKNRKRTFLGILPIISVFKLLVHPLINPMPPFVAFW